MQGSKQCTQNDLVNKAQLPGVAEAGGKKWESAPLFNEDRKIFFACRKVWLQDREDAEQDLDEETYDTTSVQPIDVIPYMVTMGYKHEEKRLEESLVQLRRIKELRKQYNVPPLSEQLWTPKWEFTCMSPEEIEQQWPFHLSGTDAEGRVVLWDKSGNLDADWAYKLMGNEEAKSAAKFYCVRQLENIMRRKVALSMRTGFRMTRHVSVLDAYNIGLTNITTMKELIDRILDDVQVMYPESLAKLYIINTGWLFQTAWLVIKGFIHPITVAKVVVLGTNYREVLNKVGIIQVPEWVM
jgi:hypothetical protein